MTTTIHSNGSKWYGEEPDTIQQLCDVMARWQLDLEHFAPFIHREGAMTGFFGNFKRLSHVFRLDTDNENVIAQLTKAIEGNSEVKFDSSSPTAAGVNSTR